MSSYIPPIEHAEATFILHILRFNPDTDFGSRWEAFEVPWVRTMTVIEALEWLWDQGKYVAFRANCREFTCGSCTMLINGKPGLACDTPLINQARLEPLRRYPVKRDLVVDTSPVQTKWQALRLWPNGTQEHSPQRLESVPQSVLDGWHRCYARCIECYACLDACPASETDQEGRFAGPMWMVQIARARAHPLDSADRVTQAKEEGIGRCVTCYECADVCPVGLSPISEIHRLRRSLIISQVKQWTSKFTGAGVYKRPTK